MAKKMQRLDESPDFRPFKFRIAAFTNAFLEEVCTVLSHHLPGHPISTATFYLARETRLSGRKDTDEEGDSTFCHGSDLVFCQRHFSFTFG